MMRVLPILANSLRWKKTNIIPYMFCAFYALNIDPCFSKDVIGNNNILKNRIINEGFVGLSIGYREGTDGKTFIPENTNLINLLREISPHGVIRDAGADFSDGRWPTSLIKPYLQFVAALGQWSVIHTLPIATKSVSEVVEEATIFAREAANAKVAITFAFANEPDAQLAKSSNFHIYSNIDNYLSAWDLYRNSVQSALYKQGLSFSGFEGPDDTGQDITNASEFYQHSYQDHSELFKKWVSRYGATSSLIGFHYYGGNHQNTHSSNDLMNRLDIIDRYIDKAKYDVGNINTPVRITEMNSISGGGTNGISNAPISALWALNEMIHIASRGVVGVNFERNPTGFYNWADPDPNNNNIWQPNPIFYSLKMFSILESGNILSIEEDKKNKISSISVGFRDGEVRVLYVNYSDKDEKRISSISNKKIYKSVMISTYKYGKKDIYTENYIKYGQENITIPALSAVIAIEK